MVVEYLDDTSSWVALESFGGAGTPGEILARFYALPAAGRHAGFQLRFRLTGGSGSPWDFWHIDDVCLLQNAIPALLVLKSVRIVSDPVRGAVNPLAIPGAVAEYSITVSNQGPGAINADTVVVDDLIPSDTEMYMAARAPARFALYKVRWQAVSPTATSRWETEATISSSRAGARPTSLARRLPTLTQTSTASESFPKGVMAGGIPGAAPSFTVILRVRVR